MKALLTCSARLMPLPALALLAACVPSAPQPTPAPSQTPAARPAPPPPAPPPVETNTDWTLAPQTPGNWRYAPESQGSLAAFGPQASETRFAMECDRAQQRISLMRHGQATGQTALTIRTETASRNLTAQPVAGAQPMLVASLSSRDPLLDAMALTKGRFAVETAGLPTLYIPAWGEVTRVIEDCR